MNDTPRPLANDVVDELLSALADDEFDAAAADAGMSPDEARARLAATPGVAQRSQAIEAARAKRRVGQWLLSAAGVAAAIAIVFALLALPGRNGDDDSSSSASRAGGVA